MPARILIVDDLDVNQKLMRARLEHAYYTPLSAGSGAEALEILSRETVDLVLLDVMMPGLDGYETCRRIKAGHLTHDIPVVLLTSLSEPQDRIRGLAAGADDFLTKPVADLPLFSRLRSLTRMKQASDDLHAKLGPLAPSGPLSAPTRDPETATILVVGDEGKNHGIESVLRQAHAVRRAATPEAALRTAEDDVELVVVDLTSESFDPLAVCSQLRSSLGSRHLPILAAAPEAEEELVWRSLDLGVDDYVSLPLDGFELIARARTYIRRRRQDEALKGIVRDSAEMAFVDPLTRLGNRRILEARLQEFAGAARRGGRPFTILAADLDHFKRINDRFGHPTGDEVLRQFADRLSTSIRSNDVACRYGGEEFIVLLDGIDEEAAFVAAERLRISTQESPFRVGGMRLDVTVSIGLAEWTSNDDGHSVLARADRALYEAKRAGRDTVRASGAVDRSLNHS